MQEMQAVRPGFSGPQEPVFRRPRRLPVVLRGQRARIPRELLEDQRQTAARVRRRVLKAVASSEGAISPEQRLVQRATMGQSPAEMARVARLGYEGYLDYQLDYEAIDDSQLEDALAEALPTLAMAPQQLFERYRDSPGRPAFELILASIYRALYSPRQLFERLAIFWTDHFNIHLFADLQPFFKPADDREVVRAHAMGSFPEMLSASAHSPAMLIYLTNDSNVKGHPNENYARELMELHTVGADNGYKQKDVREVARCFTGWTAFGPRGSGQIGFYFDRAAHDEGKKRVMGRTIEDGGIGDGERVLDILANNRRTAKYLARKMLVYFWGYQPRKKDVNRVTAAYMNSGGDIRAMLRQVLKKSRISAAPRKLKRPFHLMTSGVRGLFGDLQNANHMIDNLFLAGHLPFNWEPPNGYPDDEGFWSGFILPRWNWATTLLNGKGKRGAAVATELPFLDASLSPARIVRDMDQQLFNGAMTAETKAGIVAFLEAGKLDKNRIKDAIGLAIASPEFQEY